MSERRVAQGLIVLLITAVAGCALLLFGHYSGDALLYLPFARNAAHGDFFASTPGVFSSGSTSPLWPFILAPAYWFDHSEVVAQCIAIVVLAVALWHTHRTMLRISGSPLGAAVALVVVAYMLVQPGLLMFESALAVIVSNVLVRESFLFFRDTDQERRRLIAFSCVWGLLPLIRPDTLIILVLNVIVAGKILFDRQGIAGIKKLMIAVVCAMVPAAMYYGYSFYKTGVFSISATSRMWYFHEETQQFSGFWFSLKCVGYLLVYPSVLWCILALCGWWWERKEERTRSFRWYALITIVSFVAGVTFVVPVNASPWRYLLPIVPMLAAFVAIGVRGLYERLMQRKRNGIFALWVIIAFTAILPLGNLVRRVSIERNDGRTYDNVTDATLAEYLNVHAPKHATLLAYEAQVKLRLRPDITVLDLDGVTDGKMFPYRHDLAAFMKRYKPQYYVTLFGDVWSSPVYLTSSVLGTLFRDGTDTIGEEFVLEGMHFILLGTHSIPEFPETGAWRRLYEVRYDE